METIAQTFQLIDRKTLKAKIDAKETFQLWNVLTSEYYKPDANIPGSKWVPVNTLTEALAAEKAKKDENIVTYCGGGECKASKEAAEKLSSFGYNKVFAYEGGLKDWSEAGFPLVKA